LNHFKWLALYQCDNWTMEKIARHFRLGGGYKTVSEALKSTAELIDLPLRATDRGGRPRKRHGDSE
jgi:hypothetical protein